MGKGSEMSLDIGDGRDGPNLSALLTVSTSKYTVGIEVLCACTCIPEGFFQ